MPSFIHAAQSEHFSKLGWFASLDPRKDRLEVTHGIAVESDEHWIVEGVWDGDFAKGDFHKSENFFGSGIRLDNGQVHFVPSSAIVDRLFYCTDQDKILVANSLVILLAMTGAKLDSEHDYKEETKTILGGIDKYRSEFRVLHSTINSFHQLYFDNLVVNGAQMHLERRSRLRHINSYQQYRKILNSILISIRNNYEEPARRIPLSAFSTLSNGYDSSAVSCLVSEIGVSQCFTYTGSWSRKSEGDPAYDATPIARALNLNHIPLHPSLSANELYLYASSSVGAQPPLIAMADYIKRTCATAVVFTGYHGDVVWSVNTDERFLNSQLMRKGVSGLDLSELRLQSGFINVAVPFMLAQSVSDIVALSRQAEMKAWRLNNNYDRPIPRRILEEAGVERHLFGMKKAAVFIRRSQPLDRGWARLYFSFLRSRYGVNDFFLIFCIVGDRLCFKGLKLLIKLMPAKGQLKLLRLKLLKRRERLGEGESVFWRNMNLKSLLFLWSVETLSGALRESMQRREIPKAVGAGPDIAPVGAQDPAEI